MVTLVFRCGLTPSDQDRRSLIITVWATVLNDDVVWSFDTLKVPDLEAETTSDKAGRGDNEFWVRRDKEGNIFKLRFVNKTGKRWIQWDINGKYWLQLAGYSNEEAAVAWITSQAEEVVNTCTVGRVLHATDARTRRRLRNAPIR